MLGFSCLTMAHFKCNYLLQEEELRKSGEAKYFHLNDDLHVLIEVFAPPAEAYARMGHALEEIKKFLIPVSTFYWSLTCILRLSLYLNPCRSGSSLLSSLFSTACLPCTMDLRVSRMRIARHGFSTHFFLKQWNLRQIPSYYQVYKTKSLEEQNQ